MAGRRDIRRLGVSIRQAAIAAAVAALVTAVTGSSAFGVSDTATAKVIPAQSAAGQKAPGLVNSGPILAKGLCEPVNFKTAELLRAGGFVHLKVSGDKLRAGMSLQVRPVVYIAQPDYWLMQLVACRVEGKPASETIAPFSSEVNVSGWVGRKGIDLSGRPRSKPQRLELPA